MSDDFRLRPLSATDGPAINELSRQTPDTGAVSIYTHFLHDAYEVLRALQPAMRGVVAEVDGFEGLAGIGLMNFGQCTVEGQLLPFAYLNGLGVHPTFRRRGLAGQLADWRVAEARAKFGQEGIIFAGIQSGNTGSQRTAARWANQRVEGRTVLRIARMHQDPPSSPGNVSVRHAETADLAEIAAKQNRFYNGYNLYPPESPEALVAWLGRKAFGQRLHRYYVAEDAAGNLLAGLGLTASGQLQESRILHMPWPLRLANGVLKMVPDGPIRPLAASRFWFADDREGAGHHLWESVRWLEREQGTNLLLFFDAQSPAVAVIPKPRFMPGTGGSVLISSPVPLQEARLLYGHGGN